MLINTLAKTSYVMYILEPFIEEICKCITLEIFKTLFIVILDPFGATRSYQAVFSEFPGIGTTCDSYLAYDKMIESMN